MQHKFNKRIKKELTFLFRDPSEAFYKKKAFNDRLDCVHQDVLYLGFALLNPDNNTNLYPGVPSSGACKQLCNDVGNGICVLHF